MQVLSRQRGVSLIEVMMAVLIFSIGLIGLAALMVMATRSNHAAYLRTQVTYLAQNMANRMSANPIGVWNGSYGGTTATTYPNSSIQDCSAAACTPAQLAAHDQQIWSSQLKTFLPSPAASISCTGTSNVGYDPSPQMNFRPPYGGNCTMTIQWSEQAAGDKAHQASTPQIFVWEFQP